MKRKTLCNEGDWFLVPLMDEKYALGLVARYLHKGRIALGYFFEYSENMEIIETRIRKLTPDDTIFITLFNWPPDKDPIYNIIYHSDDWSRDKWPNPWFGHVDEINPWRAIKLCYNFDDPNNFSGKSLIVSPQEVASLYRDALYGYLALPPSLDRIIRNKKVQ